MMKINSAHPKMERFKKNEFETLQWIFTRKLFKDFPQLRSELEREYYKYKSFTEKDFKTNDFEFHAAFPFVVEGREKQVILQAHVEGDYTITSYLMAIADQDEDNNLIRKFHFDYANPIHKTNQPVPTFHLQYGGVVSDHLKDFANEGHLNQWLSVPRLCFSPINISILLDILLCEFYSIETETLIGDPDWRTLIRKNEAFILKSYYGSIYEHISAQSFEKEKKLLRDFLYGK
jgi:hypothetical protein